MESSLVPAAFFDVLLSYQKKGQICSLSYFRHIAALLCFYSGRPRGRHNGVGKVRATRGHYICDREFAG
jgi:hypothetical protein